VRDENIRRVFRDALRTRFSRGGCFETVYDVVGSPPIHVRWCCVRVVTGSGDLPHSRASKKPRSASRCDNRGGCPWRRGVIG